MFGLGEKTQDEPAAVEKLTVDENNRISQSFMAALNKVISAQSSIIIGYVERLKKSNKNASPQELQELIDKHFLNIVSGTGAAAGASAAIPGIGLVSGAAAIGAESLLFLEAAAWYILASAHLRGDDIRDEERRRALVLVVLTGSQGSALVDTLLGDVTTLSGMKSAATLSRFSGPTLSGINGRLTKLFLKQARKKHKWAWLSKLLPMGVGAVLGTTANRKLARQVMKHSDTQLSPLQGE
ncbi:MULTISPECIES: hypothetical protein [Corynebacterium]|uniref:EcsC protein family n=1 Tax=Corynebacterium singulare TaxID=161899 RepID=A0ABS9PXB4_9CORY|nr:MULTISPECIES: hypothetical protein [Corynebacterium]MCG7277333.1 hypothetical protein [Corynebacterium singulare]MCQ9677847.1 hypothetical protein [Corynebacterium sp. BF-R-2]